MTDPPGDRIHVLEVVETCGAGVGQHVCNLCEGLVAQGYSVTVAYSPYRLDRAFERFMFDQRGKIRFVELRVRREVSPVSDLRGLIRLIHLIEREGPFDIVHGHSSKGGALARLAGRWSGVPTVYTPNSLIMSSPVISRAEAAVYGSVERLLGNWATSKIIAVSQDEREFIEKLRLVPEDRVVLIENGIEDENFTYFSGREMVNENIRDKALTFGSLMRFSPQKAPGHLVEAFARLNAALPQVPTRLVIAGDGELFAGVKEQAEATGLGEKISLLGWRTDTKEVLSELDVFVLPSLFEGGPYTIMEAMAARLPVVSTSVFGTRETVAKVPGNVLVPVGDPSALARGMQKMATLARPDSLRQPLQRIGRANHDYARERFRQSESTRRTLEVYQELC